MSVNTVVVVLRPREKQQQISLKKKKFPQFHVKKFTLLSKQTMDLLCTEVLYKDQDEDDLGLGGLRSLPDRALIADDRILDNVLNGSQQLPTMNYFQLQPQIKPHMRKIVTEWMLEVTEEQKCSPEVFSLAVNYMDRVLSQMGIKKHQFQLLASVCIFLASKFKESSPLCAEKLVIYSDFSFSTEDIMVSFIIFC